ncbi:hypothetical protein BKA83DRAFT_4422996 [Pisolithus microcarpus]|nr:hypothetical protein BKA83DRAFT_4422996 [Pisolithus microcarpus]
MVCFSVQAATSPSLFVFHCLAWQCPTCRFIIAVSFNTNGPTKRTRACRRHTDCLVRSREVRKHSCTWWHGRCQCPTRQVASAVAPAARYHARNEPMP